MRIIALLVAAVGAILLAAASAGAQVVADVPDALRDVGVEEHLGAALPLGLEFVDEDGRAVRLGDYFEPGRPVLLTLNYYRCPMLCGLQLNGLVDGLRELDWSPGSEFEIVTVSIDPLETPTLAKLKKQSYLKEYGRPGAAAGWHFLTGSEPAIRRLAETVGFTYSYDEKTREYAHPAVLYLATPDGRVARYLYGVEYPARTLRLGLVESSQGTVGSPLDQLLLYCYHYDPSTRRYAPVAMNIMRLGGGVTALVFGTFLVSFWLRETRRRRRQRAS